MSKIESTKEYKKFKFLNKNREISGRHVDLLITSIKKNNLLHLRPVIVDVDFNVIDGQHRIKAAEALQVPIYFTIEKGIDDKSIIILNTVQKGWTLEAYHKYWIGERNENYSKLLSFMNAYSLSLSNALEIIASNINRASTCSLFKAGLFEFKLTEKKSKIMHQCLELVSLIKEKLPLKMCRYAKSRTFFRALRSFLNLDEVDFDEFKEKLELNIKLIRSCGLIEDYHEIFERIYNYRRKEKVNLIEKDYD